MFLGQHEVLRANLPPLSQVRQRRAVTTLLEALSLWMDARIGVALSAADWESCFSFALTDEFGVGSRSVFYAIEVVESRTRRPARIRVDELPSGEQRSLVTLRGGGQ